jgi:Tat protein secretion system quality control protein TatD with DNase activity
MLLDKGFYLSFGTAILQENSNAKEVLSQIPIEKLFFETDYKDIFILVHANIIIDRVFFLFLCREL